DQFETKTVTLLKPIRLCAPANKKDEDPSAPDHPFHLLCYQTKSAPFPNVLAYTNSQFGPDTSRLIHRRELCVPSLKNPSATTTTTSTTTSSTTTTSTTETATTTTTSTTETATTTTTTSTTSTTGCTPRTQCTASECGGLVDDGCGGHIVDCPPCDAVCLCNCLDCPISISIENGNTCRSCDDLLGQLVNVTCPNACAINSCGPPQAPSCTCSPKTSGACP